MKFIPPIGSIFAAMCITSAAAGADYDLHAGLPISQFRPELLKRGWTPVRVDKKLADGERENAWGIASQFFKAGWFEVESCSGTGRNYCIFNYQKNGECLRIVTRGERNPMIENWTDECPD